MQLQECIIKLQDYLRQIWCCTVEVSYERQRLKKAMQEGTMMRWMRVRDVREELMISSQFEIALLVI
jgi:hypothetical protein